jgi:uncharacterized delta-60 repeat protein
MRSKSSELIGAILISVLCLISVSVNAQTRDTSFNPDLGGTTWNVTSMALQADGKIVLIRSTGLDNRDRVIRLGSDGAIDSEFSSGLLIPWVHLPTVVQAGNKLLISNAVTSVMGVQTKFIARLNADGSLDNTYNADLNDAVIHSTQFQTDGKMLVSGDFSRVRDSTRCRPSEMLVARLNADGSLDQSFCPIRPKGASADVMVLQADGKVLVSSSIFSSFYFARLNQDGSIDESFRPAILQGDQEHISAMAIQKDGKILIGGEHIAPLFPTDANPSRLRCDGIARLNQDGSLDAHFAMGGIYCLPPRGHYHGSLKLQADGKILYQVRFDDYSGGYINRLNPDGSRDETFSIDAMSSTVVRFSLQADGKVLVATDNSPVNGSGDHFVRYINTYPATQTLSIVGSAISWTLGGTAPEVSRVIFERSIDGGNYVFLGNGSRLGASSTWQLTDIDLPPNSYVRARGFYSSSSEIDMAPESIIVSNALRFTLGRMLCRGPRQSALPCRRLHVRPHRYRPDPQAQVTPNSDLVRDAVVHLVDVEGNGQTILADEVGDYVFDDAIVGQTYQIYIDHSKYQFAPERLMIKENTKEVDVFAKP